MKHSSELPRQVPLLGSGPPERRDAARNRERVLAAASALFAERGVERVDMRDIARKAGVGVGTLYRRFKDKGGLVSSLLDQRERRLQEALLSGPPPLGPGASAGQRLVAFLDALADLTDENLDMLVVSENSTFGARYRIGAYAAWRLHVSILLHEARPDLDADWHADALLAPLAADLYRHQRRELGVSRDRIEAGLRAAARALLAEPTGADTRLGPATAGDR